MSVSEVPLPAWFNVSPEGFRRTETSAGAGTAQLHNPRTTEIQNKRLPKQSDAPVSVFELNALSPSTKGSTQGAEARCGS